MAEQQPPLSQDSSEKSIAPSPASPSQSAAVDAVSSPSPDDSSSSAVATESGAVATEEMSIEELLKQASFEDPSSIVTQETAEEPSSIPTENFELPNFQQVVRDVQMSSIDMLRDVDLNVKIELGRTRMMVEDVLKLSEGSVVELDKLAGDPVDVFVNDRLVARGEVLVLNDNFCVRINEIVAGGKEEGM
jgi:flagellar motor switch protein FliN